MSTSVTKYSGQTTTEFNQKYITNFRNLYAVSRNLTTKTFWTDISFLFQNPSDAMVSCRFYPLNLLDWLDTTQLGAQLIDMKLYKANSGGEGYAYNSAKGYNNVGQLEVTRKYNDFRDYAPYTKLELYLPFCSIVNLDTNLVMGKTLYIDYSIDLNTGGCTAYVSIFTDDNKKVVLLTANGQIGFEIPLGSTSANENAKQVTSMALSVVAGTLSSISSGNWLPAALSITSAVGKTFDAFQQRISKGGNASGCAVLDSPFDIYLMRTSMVSIGDGSDEYAKYKGRPLYEDRTLGDLTGFTKVERVHVDNLPTATETEKQMIEQQLLSGVIL